jgi:predicted flap endonuclease-1-like 5' DNA nuclease
MEDPVAWFAWQSAVVILLAFLLGALVGYWFFRIQWRRVAFTESEAVTVVSRRHEKALAQHETALSQKDAEIERLQGLLAAGTAAVADETDATPDGDAALPAAAAETVNLVDVPEPGPGDDAVVDVTDEAVSAAPDPDPDAASEAGPGSNDAAARAVAALPTQAGDASVIDLAALENGAPAEATVEGELADAEAPADDVATTPGQAADTAVQGLVGGTAGDDDGDPDAEDDLERIEGIGPRIASALRSAGVRSFRRLADTDVPTLQSALEAAGLRFAPSLPTWSRQARFLADGDEVGFVKLTESLVAGREPGSR